MRKILVVGLLLTLSLSFPALAVEDGQAIYVGGSVAGVTAGVIGHLDTTSDTELIFQYSGNKLAIPYNAIQSFEYSRDVTRHLGVLPAIAAGLLKARRHQHFFRISYRDSNQVEQAAVFEVPKHMPRTLRAVLETRAPGTCRPCVGRY